MKYFLDNKTKTGGHEVSHSAIVMSETETICFEDALQEKAISFQMKYFPDNKTKKGQTGPDKKRPGV
jgi:hypothetical protein